LFVVVFLVLDILVGIVVGVVLVVVLSELLYVCGLGMVGLFEWDVTVHFLCPVDGSISVMVVRGVCFDLLVDVVVPVER